MKKLLYIALLINFLLVPFQYVMAETFSDADDIFKVISPTPNSKVGGTINIEWNSFDDDQTAIPYYVELLDGATCRTTSFGRINPNSASNSSSSSNNKITWDTKKTISTQSLNDGDYCLQICSAFKNTDAFYSICNSRRITIVNVNKLPTITSAPSYLTINESEPWQYQAKASDVDSDSLKYYLVFAPEFLEINGSTGLIKTKQGASRISGDLNIAEYRVVVGVDDGVSGTTTQEFTIRIERGREANPSTGTGTSSGGTATPQNTPSQITFSTPKENEEFKGTQNFVDWSIYDADGIQEVTLNYSQDLESWTEIVTKTEDNFSRYSWDVNSLVDGKYYLQLKVKDKKNEVVAKISKPFLIKNEEVDNTANKPMIINIRPENTKVVNDSPAGITGDFAPAEGETIDIESFKLTLDDVDLTPNCVKNEAGFQCTIKDKLAVGDHQIKAEVSDLNGNQGTFESSFNFTEKTVVTEESIKNENSNVVVIIIALILLMIVLIGLPWFFIGYSKRRVRTSQNKVVTNTDPTKYAYPQAAVTYNAPVQNQPIPALPATQQTVQQPDQSKDFSEFMNNYSFSNNEPQKQNPQNSMTAQVEQKRIGEVKPPKSQAPKTSMSDSLKNIKDKVTNFIPRPPSVNNANPESKPVQLTQNPNLSQNIEMAYSGGTSTDIKSPTSENFVEPKIIEEPVIAPQQSVYQEPPKIESQPVTAPVSSELETPVASEQTEEELRKMYPELYSTPQVAPNENPPSNNVPSTDNADDYFEPKPKD